MKDIIKGYKVLYDNSYIHRDLKPANILKKGDVFKIADFGFAAKVDKNNTKFCMDDFVGSPLYESP